MKFGLRAKIIIIVIAVFLLATGLNTFILSRMLRKDYSAALQSKMDVIANTLRSQIERLLGLGIAVENIEGFDAQCQEVLRKHKDVAYVMVTRTNGRILFHNDPTQHGTIINDLRIHEALTRNLQMICLNEVGGQRYYNTIVPVGGDSNIAVIVGFPTALIDRKIQELRHYSFMGAIVSLAIATSLLLTILSISVTKPLSILLSTIKEIRTSADLNKRVKLTSKDELGYLADSFNEMADYLQKTTTSIDNLNREITERKNAEEQLRKTEEKYRTQFEGALDAIFVAEAETGILVDCNPAATRLVGREKSELIGQSQQILHPKKETKGGFSKTFKQHLEEKQGQTLETQVITKNGEIKDVAIKASIIEVGSKKLLQGIFRDVTDRKKVEQSLKDLNEKLIRSNQQLQEFTHVASHDLKEPTRKINSFAQLLVESLKDKLNNDERENLQFMIDGANRMKELVEAMVLYSQVNTKDVQFERFDLNEIIEQLKELELAVKLEETNGTISVPEPLPAVKGDPTQIRQLLQNLISNALKYHKKDVLPEVTIRAHKQDNEMVRVEMQDNGIGIKKEQCDKVFVMFRRIHPRDEYEGTGIGLAICKRIIERHRGEIGVESTYGQGSTFWFTLPASDSSEKKHDEPILLFERPEINNNQSI